MSQPDPIPPRALGHIQAAIDHLKLAEHYVIRSRIPGLESQIGEALAYAASAHDTAEDAIKAQGDRTP